jgi:hypothetical protein
MGEQSQEPTLDPNQWPSRVALKPGYKNVVRDSLIDPRKELLPPLHIKLGLMKQFVKALRKKESVLSICVKCVLVCQKQS